MARTVICRPLKSDDATVWHQIFESVAVEGRWIGAEAPVPFDWFQNNAEAYTDQQDRVVFVAEVAKTPVGWITVEIVEVGTAELGMGVLKKYRHQGVGTAMMESAIGWAIANGADHLTLNVFPDNEAAIALYRKFGFTEVELKPKAWERKNGDLWDLLAMERRLRGSDSSNA